MKDINLVDSYMHPADFRFYTTEWTPNGTSMLLIVDNMDQVVGSIDEALFGPPLDNDRNGAVFDQSHYWDGTSVWLVNKDEELLPNDMLFPLTKADVLRHIAVSPVQSSIDVLRQIVSLIKS